MPFNCCARDVNQALLFRSSSHLKSLFRSRIEVFWLIRLESSSNPKCYISNFIHNSEFFVCFLSRRCCEWKISIICVSNRFHLFSSDETKQQFSSLDSRPIVLHEIWINVSHNVVSTFWLICFIFFLMFFVFIKKWKFQATQASRESKVDIFVFSSPPKTKHAKHLFNEHLKLKSFTLKKDI